MRFLIVVGLVAGLALPAAAADRAPAGASGSAAPGAGAAQGKGGAAGASSPEAKELARSLISQQEWEQVLDHYASGLTGQVEQSLAAKGEKAPAGLQARLRDELGKELPYQQVVDQQARALTGKFTPDELKRAAAFYSSPLGTKIVQALPEAQAELGHELQGRLATAVPQIVQRVAPKALASEGPSHGPGPAPGRPAPDAKGEGMGSTSQEDGAPAAPPPSTKKP